MLFPYRFHLNFYDQPIQELQCPNKYTLDYCVKIIECFQVVVMAPSRYKLPARCDNSPAIILMFIWMTDIEWNYSNKVTKILTNWIM
jgi:hypothetical protein